jgi:CBS domain-containing protein
MQLQGKALRVTIYIGESDHYQGKALHSKSLYSKSLYSKSLYSKSLYMALLQFLKQEGASGATVVRGLAGFGAKSRIHTAAIVDLSTDLPIRVEWVDQVEVVERLLPQVRQMVDDGLITVEEVDVVQYAPGRRPDPLAQPVQDVMRTEVVTVAPDAPVAEVVSLLLQKGYRSLPVVDGNGRPQGIITDGDLLRRAGLSTRLDLQTELPTADWQQQLAELRAQNVMAVSLMTSPLITIPVMASLRQAVEAMTQHNLKRLPAVDGNGRLAGWISRVDILRTVEYHQPAAETEPEPPATGVTIRELMYRDVPTVSLKTTLEEIVQALEQNRRRRAVVVDDAHRVLGIITDGDLLRRSQKDGHPGLLDRLRRLVTGQPPTTSSRLLNAAETAADLMTTPVNTILVTASPAAALRLMVQHGVKRLPVVDENGRLVGLLGRASLLRSLLDEL